MKKRLIWAPIAACLLLAACVPIPSAVVTPHAAPSQSQVTTAGTAVPADGKAPVLAGPITEAALANASYSGVYDQPVTLANGLWEGEHAGGDASRPTVELIPGAEVYGDLDGDGVDDAVVFLVERSGGSGVFTHVAAQLNREGRLADAGAVRIEDRIQVKSAAIKDGQIMLDIITHGPDDVACCARHKARTAYALQEGRLAEVAGEGENLPMVTAADLEGTRWTLSELRPGQRAPQNPQVTLSFEDGQVTGSGGCNNYMASFKLDDVNPFVLSMGPVAATKRSCPEPVASQETAYLSALQHVGQWGYVFGRLALYYTDVDGAPGRLLFEPETATQ